MEVPMKLTGQAAHITVLLSDTFSDSYKPFHCSACGNIVFSYNEDTIRTILSSGRPAIDKPGKIYQCNGIMKLRSTASIYDVLYDVLAIAMQSDNIEELRTSLSFIAQNGKYESNVRCKMQYFIS